MKFCATIFSILFLSVFTCSGQIIFTVAGGNIDTAGVGDGGSATLAQLSGPNYVCQDKKGNLYISDSHHNRIRKVNSERLISTAAGTGVAGYSGENIPATAAMINGSAGIVVDSLNNIYFATTGRLCKIDTNGYLTTFAGTGISGYTGDNGPATAAEIQPSGMVFKKDGSLYFTDFYHHCLRKIALNGIVTTIAGTGVGGYNGDHILATAAQLYRPAGICIDSIGNIYFADYFNHRVRKIDTSGIITTVAGTGITGYNGDNIGADSANLNYPIGVVLDLNCNLYISDVQTDRIRVVKLIGDTLIATYAGDGLPGYNGDYIPATNAELNEPAGMALGMNGELFFCDYLNEAVRCISNNLGTDNPSIQIAKCDLFPNPNSGNINLKITSTTHDIAHIRLTNATGQIICNWDCATNQLITLTANPPPGIYIITIYLNYQSVNYKIAFY